MTAADLQPATEPTFYFVGVTTAKSSIMKVYPLWAQHLGLPTAIRGIDCRQHDEPENYRRIVRFLKDDKLSLGGLVTTHKIDLMNAARDLFDEVDSYAELLGEVSCISKRHAKLRAHAKDPITSGLALESFLPPDYWKRNDVEVCLLGAGGSALALTVYLMERCAEDNRPSRVIVTNRSAPRLESMRIVHANINPGIRVEYHHCPNAQDNDEIVSNLKPGSLVVNATGLGKDAPGSPITDQAVFPLYGYVWEYNYRGDLLFLRQALAQEAMRSLHVEDGWNYFIFGWTHVIAEVFDIDVPDAGPEFEALSKIAAEAR